MNRVYDRILVPVDGSPVAEHGLDEAMALARALGGRAALRLVHVVDEALVPPSIDAPAVDLTALVELLQEQGATLLDTAADRVRAAGLPCSVVLLTAVGGRAGDEIVRAACEWPASLVVCGTHGRRGLRRVVLGSDAERVVIGSPVPVLLVRGPPGARLRP